MDRGLMMVVHAAIVGVVLYVVMALLLKQNQAVAEDRSILASAIVLTYMVLFGHGLPRGINPNIY